ncbi:UNVERIFIED_CONTAM: hypothetical protein DV101_06265 [Bifidobacterium animalis]|uniref:Uncharacterized protein n=1 Tax=Bifidobacterium animalis subsp. lactis CNCM I-2494 TaxID=1042403 RepID=A0A806FHX8_BIFAN|nr:hypothetical protein BALAC2494_01475 [Bifidobacterium animalis subsp. lactis CNCM I-2494]AXM94235.1 hypothetical protein CJD49_08285 [Bifidobacterium animalis subsp. lactis]KAB5632650.1 hypothetical protein GBA51_06615 [Bifidobacterium animalis]PIN31913.1 hypothetical protein CUC13_05610 [Bifidobacterium animalis subsp. lactis BB-12]AXQ17840.1 hypothetical protein D0Y52_02995 [Bifidobacterium animalis subsp. lactis]
MVVLWRRSQSFDVNRFTLYSENIWNTTTDTDDANGAPLADPSRPAPSCAQHGHTVHRPEQCAGAVIYNAA